MAWALPHGSLASSHALRQAWDISRISSYFFGAWRTRLAAGSASGRGSVRSRSATRGRGFVCVKRIQLEEESSVIRCKANPFDLVCECKGSRKIGICAHILAVTHCWVKEGNLDEQRRLAFCNLRLMTQALTTKTKKGAKWMKGKGATKILHYLYKEVPKEVDSSDDEEDVSFIPHLKW